MISRDENAASTELSYIFTFLLGVALLSTFTFWTYNIETATRERWNEGAIEANLDDIAEAIERQTRMLGITIMEHIQKK